MYVLYVDESGSHGRMHDNQAYVLAGIAIHEHDVARLGRELHELVSRFVPRGANADEFELHAAELRAPDETSPWRSVDGNERRAIRQQAMQLIASFVERDGTAPMRILVEVLQAGARLEREAYGRLLNRFDDWLAVVAPGEGGMVISDVSKREREIQRWSDDWREAAGPWGQLERLVEVPLFANSKASRLLQAADLVAWATWRRFGLTKPDRQWWNIIEPRVELGLNVNDP